MPITTHRVLANNEIIAQNQAEIFRNKYGDTIIYTYLGMGIVNGRGFTRCTALARSGAQTKLLKSFAAAVKFIDGIRKEETIFGRA